MTSHHLGEAIVFTFLGFVVIKAGKRAGCTGRIRLQQIVDDYSIVEYAVDV